MKHTIAALLTSGVLFPHAVAAQPSACGAGHLLTVDGIGAVESGSKNALRRAVASGMPIRVGWGIDVNGDRVPEVSHWADAGFLSEFEGEVFAQIDDIQRQQPMRGQSRIVMPPSRQRWTGLVGTNGTLEGHFDDGTPATATRVRSTWCVDPRAQICVPEWRLVYRHDADGQPLTGTKQALLDAVRRGASLRVAWGFSGAAAGAPVSVEHVAEPVFLTIMHGDHVFIQLPEHIAQSSYARPVGARFDAAGVMWRGLMGSDGTFDAVYVDRASGKEVRRSPQRAGLAWFALLPSASCATQAPLELAVPGGARAEKPPAR